MLEAPAPALSDSDRESRDSDFGEQEQAARRARREARRAMGGSTIVDDATVKLTCSPLPSLADFSQHMLGSRSTESYCSGVSTPLVKEDREDQDEARWRLTLRGAHARFNGKEFFIPNLKVSLTFD